MLEHSREWMASRYQERFQVYREAKRDFESYLSEHQVSDERYTSEVFRHAAADSRLRRAEEGFRRAIEMTRSDACPDDLVVALLELGWLLHLCGRVAEARNVLYESLGMIDRVNRLDARMLSAMSTCQYHLGLLDIDGGHYAAARMRLNISTTLLDEHLGEPWRAAMGQAALQRCPAGEGTAEPKPDVAAFLSAAAETPDVPEAEEQQDYLAASDEEVEIPGVFSESTREAVWIIAAGAESAATLRQVAQRACPQKRELIIFAAATQSGAFKPPPLEPGTSLCAALFEVSPEALVNQDFRYWLRWCIGRANTAVDFRLFVHLRGFAESQLVELANHDPLIAELRDKVQLHRPDRLDLIEINLRSHLLRLEVTRDVDKGRVIRVTGLRVFGWVCSVALWGPILFWLASSAGAVMLGKEVVIAELTRRGLTAQWLGFLAGLPLAWATLIPAAIFMQNWRRVPGVSIRAGRSFAWVVFGLLVARASLWLPMQIHAPERAMVAGGMVGLLMEAARRRRATLARTNLLTMGRRMEEHHVPRSMLTPGNGDPMQWPLFSTGSKVFLSYSRSSAWGSECANRLYVRLKAMGYDTFLDRRSIPLGASWQHQLDEQIGETDIFVALCDKHTVQRSWVAAELGAALLGRHRSGFPQILLAQEEALGEQALAEARPLFRDLLVADWGRQSAVQLITLSDPGAAVQMVTALLAQHPTRAAVFPSWLRSVLLGIASPFMMLLSLATILGLPALLIGVGVKFGKIDLQSWFTHATLWWLGMATAVLIGSTLRQAFTARFQGLAKQKGRGAWSAQTFSALGFLILGLPLWRQFHGIDFVWALAAAWMAVATTAFTAEEALRVQRHRALLARV